MWRATPKVSLCYFQDNTRPLAAVRCGGPPSMCKISTSRRYSFCAVLPSKGRPQYLHLQHFEGRNGGHTRPLKKMNTAGSFPTTGDLVRTPDHWKMTKPTPPSPPTSLDEQYPLRLAAGVRLVDFKLVAVHANCAAYFPTSILSKPAKGTGGTQHRKQCHWEE